MLLLLACIFSLCGVFSNNYQTNMIFLVHTTRKEHSSVFWAKYGLISGFSFRWLSMLTLSSGFGLPMLLRSSGVVWLAWLELAKILLVIAGLLLYHRKRYINEC